MTTTDSATAARAFYTVREAVAELRVNKNTFYRAIHADAP